MKTCTWLKPKKGHLVVFAGKGRLISRMGSIVTDHVSSDGDAQWGQVSAVAEGSTFSIGDVVVFIKYDGVEAPSPADGLDVVVLPEDAVVTSVDVSALMAEAQRIHDEAEAAQKEASERLAKARAEHVKSQSAE